MFWDSTCICVFLHEEYVCTMNRAPAHWCAKLKAKFSSIKQAFVIYMTNRGTNFSVELYKKII